MKKQFTVFVLGSMCIIANFVHGMDIEESEWVSDEPSFSRVDETIHLHTELSKIIDSQPKFKRNLHQYNFPSFYAALSEFMKNTPAGKDQTLTEKNSLAFIYPKFCEKILKEGIKISGFPHMVIDHHKETIANQLSSLWEKWIVATYGNFDKLANYSMLGACLLAEISEKGTIGDHIMQGDMFGPIGWNKERVNDFSELFNCYFELKEAYNGRTTRWPSSSLDNDDSDSDNEDE